MVEKRTDLILTGDWHIRDDTPVARTDNFWQTQIELLKWLKWLQKEKQCPIIHSGDLFDHWKPSPMLLAMLLEHIPDQFYTIYGNHDLPQHNTDLAYKCGINVLEKAGKLKVLSGTHWGKKPKKATLKVGRKQILVYHVMTFLGECPWPGCTDLSAKRLIKRLTDYSLVLTGHNHKTFQVQFKDTILYNPGSIMRQTADQIDFKPSVGLYNATESTIEKLFIPESLVGMISREHLQENQEKVARYEAFLDKAKLIHNPGHSFRENMAVYFSLNKIKEPVKKLILESMEEEV